jgi:hypothetical protein
MPLSQAGAVGIVPPTNQNGGYANHICIFCGSVIRIYFAHRRYSLFLQGLFSDLRLRTEEYNEGRNREYTKKFGKWKLVYYE